MIKGAVIFGAGFMCGVAYASSRMEAVERAAYAFAQFVEDQSLKTDVERKQQADAEAASEEAPGDKPIEAEVVDPGDTPIQGETPS